MTEGALETSAVLPPDPTAVLPPLENVNDEEEPGEVQLRIVGSTASDRLPEDDPVYNVGEVEEVASLWRRDVRRFANTRLIVALKTTRAPTIEPTVTVTIANIFSRKFDSFCFQGTVAADE